jgi:diaminopimelate decarboxylase
VFVDGSMADHIRTALYQAKYEAALINRMDEYPTIHYTIAGRACESGDILIHDCILPEVKLNDYLAVFTTGAYHYSMSSNYNRLLKPAVLFVNNETVRIVNKRETYDDLIRQDCL